MKRILLNFEGLAEHRFPTRRPWGKIHHYSRARRVWLWITLYTCFYTLFTTKKHFFMKKQEKVSIASYSAIPRESYRLATARSTASACCHGFRMVAAATGDWLRWGRISIFSVRVQFGSYMNYKTIFELITRIVNPIFDQFTLPCSDNIRKRPNLIEQKRSVSPEGYESTKSI